MTEINLTNSMTTILQELNERGGKICLNQALSPYDDESTKTMYLYFVEQLEKSNYLIFKKNKEQKY